MSALSVFFYVFRGTLKPRGLWFLLRISPREELGLEWLDDSGSVGYALRFSGEPAPIRLAVGPRLQPLLMADMGIRRCIHTCTG